ncbi:uncharacterized protein LOC113493584 [Trichoplusia ni]|uniref:Uncharacterized protein LOC113493584 n=1 Tax=Trichoplusia ni TaxID=7111 RepID=A0A7E5VGK2_TRINI|nr:uncharacterized protein LOC113493584 [Trichoplusia ni]
MSSRRYAVSFYLAIIAIIFYRNTNHWLRLWTNVNGSAYFPSFLDIPGRSNDLEFVISPHFHTTVLGEETLPYPTICPIYFASTDGSGDGKEPEPIKREEEPPQEAQQPESRIPTFDEFERFKDSSRPPDSHYTSDLSGPRRAGTNSIRNNFYIATFGVCLVFIVY